MRKILVLVVAAASLGGIAIAGPASAACALTDPSCTTTVVAVPVTNAGTLSILAAPLATGVSALSLGTSTTSAAGLPVISGSMTLTTVTDTRLSSAGWTVTATADAFSATIGTATASIPGSAASFTVPTAVATLGSPTLNARSSTVANGGTIISAGPASGSTTLGPNTVQYTPHISVSVPAGTALATYTGTVTQSVA